MEEIEDNDLKNISMRYYDFFTKIYLVVVAIWNSFALAINLKDVEDIFYAEMWNISLAVFVTITIIGNIVKILLPIKLRSELKLKTKLGYKLLFGFLIFDYIFRIIISTTDIYLKNSTANLEIYSIIFLMIYSIWYIPNFIYFANRSKVFVNRK